MGKGKHMTFDETQRVEERRRAVQMLIPRRLSLTRMAEALEEMGFTNDSGEQFSKATIHADINFIKNEVHQATIQDAVSHKTTIYAEYQELLRLHWQNKNYKEVRLVLKDLRDMMGTDAPSVIVHEQMERRMDEIIDRLEMEFAKEPETWERIQAAIMGQIVQEASKDGLYIN